MTNYIQGNNNMINGLLLIRNNGIRRQQDVFLKSAKEKNENLSTKNVYVIKLPIKNKRKIKTFRDKQRLSEFIPTSNALKYIKVFQS